MTLPTVEGINGRKLLIMGKNSAFLLVVTVHHPGGHVLPRAAAGKVVEGEKLHHIRSFLGWTEVYYRFFILIGQL